ncbi:MAG: hypothetical protein COA47_16410 [Robiginitomaculum sp.]|nr:MAG: hypothetical protein COA47_16410 [Robiginitomaculum sp.]
MPATRPILILGMHRSGTSCLAGSLEEAGLYLGEVNTKAGFNAKGNRENRTIMELHDQVLERVGASWDRPPVHDPVWTSGETSQFKQAIADFGADRVWGLKDPRSLFMLKNWQDLVGPRFIGTFRHPLAVAGSLMHRANIWKKPMDETQAFAMWQSYNQRMLQQHETHAFDIIRFDIPATEYLAKLKMAGEYLGLEVPEHPKFLDGNLQNQHSEAIAVPHSLIKTWEALNDLAC